MSVSFVKDGYYSICLLGGKMHIWLDFFEEKKILCSVYYVRKTVHAWRVPETVKMFF
jgi:hypothetical protein